MKDLPTQISLAQCSETELCWVPRHTRTWPKEWHFLQPWILHSPASARLYLSETRSLPCWLGVVKNAEG